MNRLIRHTKRLNKFLNLLSITAFLLLMPTLNIAQANDKAEDAKCYVEISEGINIISFWETSAAQLSNLPTEIINKKIRSTYAGKESTYIEKVYECVLLNERFSFIAANNLDKKTPR